MRRMHMAGNERDDPNIETQTSKGTEITGK